MFQRNEFEMRRLRPSESAVGYWSQVDAGAPENDYNASWAQQSWNYQEPATNPASQFRSHYQHDRPVEYAPLRGFAGDFQPDAFQQGVTTGYDPYETEPSNIHGKPHSVRSDDPPISNTSCLGIVRNWLRKLNPCRLGGSFKKFKEKEPPKAVCSESKSKVLLNFAFVHLPAIAVTLALLSLYIKKVIWIAPTAGQLNALQFAAKAHEALIIFSLTDILLHRICYGLLTQEYGIPLGFVSSAFHLGSPIQYLLSWELWAGILHSTAQRRFQAFTGFIIILIAILCIGANPLSAIVMIPRRGWWYQDEPVYFEVIQGKFYPTELGADNVYPNVVPSSSGSLYVPSEIDQASMLQNLISSLSAYMSGGFGQGFGPDGTAEESQISFYNTTYTNYLSSRSRTISLSNSFSVLSSQNASESLIVATCPMSFIADASDSLAITPLDAWIVKFEEQVVSSLEIKKWKQPLLGVDCSEAILNDNGTANFEFNSDLVNKSTSLSDQTHPKLAELIKDETPLGPAGYQVLNLADMNISSLSGNILFAAYVNESETGGNWVKTAQESNRLLLSLCLTSARWIEADVWVERGISATLQSGLGFANSKAAEELRTSSNSSDFIKMKYEWLNGTDFQTSSALGTSYQQMLDLCLAPGGGFYPDCFALSVASHLADALSQPTLGQSSMQHLGGPDDPFNLSTLNPEKDTIIRRKLYRDSYAYRFEDSITIPLAFALLLFHVLLVVIHITAIMSSKHPWYSSSWRSFGQMMILALQSKAPDELGNVGGGVQSSETWTKVAAVRALGDEGRLQMILSDLDRSEHQSEGLGGVYESGMRRDSEMQSVKAGVKYR